MNPGCIVNVNTFGGPTGCRAEGGAPTTSGGTPGAMPAMPCAAWANAAGAFGGSTGCEPGARTGATGGIACAGVGIVAGAVGCDCDVLGSSHALAVCEGPEGTTTDELVCLGFVSCLCMSPLNCVTVV